MYEEIVNLIEQKIQMMKEFETISSSMVIDDIDAIEALDERRLAIVEKLKNIDKEIKNSYENSPNADCIYRAIRNEEDRCNVAKELLPIFDKAQEMYIEVSRIKSFQEDFSRHLDELKLNLLNHIKENKQNSKVTKYLNAMDQQVIPEGSLLSNKKA